MSKYSEMSDFEINCEILAVTEPDVAHMQLSADQKSFFHCGFDGNGFYETVIPDYCNSWADGGPIIQENSIDIEKDIEICCEECNGYYETDYWTASHWEGKGRHACDENPLRAAMIVFLMMHEVTNEC